jgi:hypothetical protein
MKTKSLIYVNRFNGRKLEYPGKTTNLPQSLTKPNLANLVFLSLKRSAFAASYIQRFILQCLQIEPLLGQTKSIKIGLCWFSAKQAALRRKSKDWLAQNQDNVSEWGNMFIRGLLFQWAVTSWIFFSDSSLKQQSADKHVAPLWHIILILSQPVFALSP